MVILGVDPGSRATGYGLIAGEGQTFRHVSSGVIRLRVGTLAERLVAIESEVQALLATWAPEQLAIEGLFHARSPRTAIVLGHARGVVLLAARRGGVEVAEYAPRVVKLAVTGSGRASKEQVRAMVARLVVDAPQSIGLDQADALAVALCHGYRQSDPRLGVSDRPRSWAAYVARVKGAKAGAQP